MTFITLALKNAAVKWWRSLTLGFLIFAIALIMILCGSLIRAISGRVEQVVAQSVTGHVQIRSDRSMEGDMVEQYQKGWDALKPISPVMARRIEEILDRDFPAANHFRLVRQGAFFVKDGKREETMLIGIDPDQKSYREAFLLEEGNYLTEGGADEILLTVEQAKSFGVKAGDRITVTTKNRYGLNARTELKVAGAGNFILLSLFSYKACYLHPGTVRKLVGLEDEEATDLILFLSNPRKTESLIRNLAATLQKAGIAYAVTRDDRLKSEDLQVKSLSLDGEKDEPEKVKISGYGEMGQTFKSAGDIMSVTLNILVVFLMVIVGLLIINLVYMMGIERYREIGTLRAIGFSRGRIITVFLQEILAVTLGAGLLGVLAGAGLVHFIGQAGIPSPVPAMDYILGRTLTLQLDPNSIFFTIGILMLFSLGASFYPAYKASSVTPARSLRTF